MYPDIDAVVRLLSDEILPQTMERWSWNPEPVVAHEQ